MYKYLRGEIVPTIFCKGCGGGTVLNTYAHAIDELGIDTKNIVHVTGIGCSSWIPSPYFLADTLHTTHGRAIAFATGVKIMKPSMHVVVIAGDGDLIGIGGNHLIHAARRNIGLTVFLVNNFIYGMTGGQTAPTTPKGDLTTTSPYGNIEQPFNIAELVGAAGANYCARWTTYHAHQLKNAMKEALQVKGFSFIEIISQCPTSYGKSVNMKSPVDFIRYFKTNSIRVSKVKDLKEEELEGKFIVGKLFERQRSELTEDLQELIRKKEALL